MGSCFQFSLDDEGIGTLTFDLPGEKVNKISLQVLEELESLLDQISSNKAIKALAISSSKEDIFIAGADLNSFEQILKDPPLANRLIAYGHRVFNKLENLPYPTIAMINGACLGGGMELALACTYRVVSDNPKCVLGLPEVSLGIIPGWGGTQRMPRLVGLVEGLPLILSGRPIKAYKAWKIGLADALIPKEFFKEESKAFIRKILTKEGRKEVSEKRNKRSWSQSLLEGNPLGRSFLFNRAEKDVVKKTKGHYPSPIIALNLIKETYTLPLNEGLNKEIETFNRNVNSAFANSQNLIHLFFVQETLKKDQGADAKPKCIQSTGVIGAGIMGSGISWLLSNQYPSVRFKDINWEAIAKGYGNAYSIYKKMVQDKKLKKNEASLKFHRLSGTVDYSGFRNTDIVIEAAVESLDLKHKILKELEEVVRQDTIIGTNTSSLTIADMAAVMRHPERLVGMHFFNPANKMPLVEIVAGEKTSPEVIATAVDVSRKLGKTPIVVKDCPGFLVNRIFVIGANEIMQMYQEGVERDRIEKIMLDFGMPMSPFLLADEVGNDIGYKVSQVFNKAYGERMPVPQLVEIMFKHQLLGKKSGKGFYLYSNGKKEPNPEVEKLRREIKNQKNSGQISDQAIKDRAILTMVNEATRCLQEKVVTNPAYLDMAMIMGTGFPPFRGGLLRYADSLGIDEVVDKLNALKEQHGVRFEPCELLKDMKTGNMKFF